MEKDNIEQAHYDVFISYSRKDYLDENGNVRPNNIVSKIKSLLEDNSITYWFDEDGIYSGDSFGEKIAKMIKQSSVFVFISTKNSNASSWTSDEIATARSYNKKIIPFRYDGSTYNDSVILFIAKLDYIDYSKGEKKAFCSLLSSIRNHKVSLDQEEKRVKEKEAKDERARQQAIIISEIKDETTELSEKEKELDVKRKGIRHRINSIDSIEAKNKLNELLAETNSEAYQLKKKINVLLEDKKKLEGDLKSTKYFNCRRRIYLPAVILLSVLSILFMILFFDREQDYQGLSCDYAEMFEKYSQICDSYPILITELNVTNSAGQKNEMDGTKTDYVHPEISYKSFLQCGEIDLLVKIFETNGQLSRNEGVSPKGYTYSEPLSIGIGGVAESIGGWGYKDKGRWNKGKYRIEVWFNDCCLKASEFVIQ